jgi:hypothetical protein
MFTNGKYMKVVPMASQKEFTGKHTDFIKQAR